MNKCFRLGSIFAALATTVVLATHSEEGSPTSSLGVGRIPSDSPLLNIDPALVECGRDVIVLMNATRTSTGWADAPFPAFHVIGNTYSVGIQSVTAYLIETDDGLILIDTTWYSTVPLVAEGIQDLGFNLEDIKIILGSHAHADHQGGSAWMQERAPGAKFMIMEGDAETVEAGVPAQPGNPRGGMPPIHVDRVLEDGDKVSLGGVTVTAWKTAGHTPGATSFEWETTENGETYNVVIVGSNFVANPLIPEGYPGVVDDQILTWTRYLSLSPDVWFGGHPWQHNNVDKYEAMLVGAGSNPFIDPEGYRCLIAARSYEFVEKLRSEEAAAFNAGQ